MHYEKNKASDERGIAVLMVMVMISIVLGTMAAGYMLLITSQHRLVSQSMNWNTAMSLAEAGIEEGLSQMNINFGTNYAGSATTNWSYSSSSQIYGPVTRTFPNGSYSAIIKLNGGPCPSIIATGYAASLYNLPTAKRVVCVDTTNYSPFIGAMNTRLGVNTSGSGMMIDSYDSDDTSHSTNGLYYAPWRLAGGDVASLAGSVDLQNAQVYGKLRLGILCSYSLNNGSVGDLPANWTRTAGTVEPGWLETDFNALWKDVQPPFASTDAGVITTLPAGTGTNTYLLGTGKYYQSSLTVNNGETVYVNGNAVLYVAGTVNFKSTTATYVTIAPGCSLKVYVGVTSTATSHSAQLGLVNTTGKADSFQYFGLPSNNSLTFSGNGVFTGTVYAPNATLTLSGGGSSSLDFQGACTVKFVDMNGHLNFHYDQALSRAKPGSGFTITSWREL